MCLPVDDDSLDVVDVDRADDHLVVESALLRLVVLLQPLDVGCGDRADATLVLDLSGAEEDHFEVQLAVVLDERRARAAFAPLPLAQLERVRILALGNEPTANHRVVRRAVLVLEDHHVRTDHHLADLTLHRILLPTGESRDRLRVDADEAGAVDVRQNLFDLVCHRGFHISC